MSASEMLKVDCRGMQCPAPILRLAKTAKEVRGKPVILEVLADDADFPNDLEAWCRTARATLHEIADERGVHRAVVGLNGGEVGAPARGAGVFDEKEIMDMPTSPPPLRAVPPPLSASLSGLLTPPSVVVSPVVFDLRGRRAPEPILRLSDALHTHGGEDIAVQSDDPSFLTDVVAWAAATRTQVVESRYEGSTCSVRLRLPVRSAEAEFSAAFAQASRFPHAPTPPQGSLAPSAVPQSQAIAVPTSTDMVPRRNQCTILILRSDFESLMAALLTATTSAAQGMDVVIFFSFWGVNLLRGDRVRKTSEKQRVSIMQKMMKWMMPKGPRRQKLSKMNMGGVGKGMMELLMRKNNVMSMEALLATAVEQNVKFVVCTMSMGIMGIQKRDLMELPNLDYAGVTLFVEQSRQSAMSLVF